jgi:hypothetical protein
MRNPLVSLLVALVLLILGVFSCTPDSLSWVAPDGTPIETTTSKRLYAKWRHNWLAHLFFVGAAVSGAWSAYHGRSIWRVFLVHETDES